jgi:hypothetical protein
MNPLKWFKTKAFGETVKDYGQVLEWDDWGTRRVLRVELTRQDAVFFLLARSSTSAMLSKYVVITQIPISPGLLENMIQVLQDARARLAPGDGGKRG